MTRFVDLSIALSLALLSAGCAATPAQRGHDSANGVVAGVPRFGETEITTWQDGKTGAVSLTFDDGIITQFTRALPTMNRLGLPGTFYVVTGEIAGSKHPARFVGRPIDVIVQESRSTPTTAANFFERAGALQYSGYEGTYELHWDAYGAYNRGRFPEAHRLVDQAYARIRAGEFERGRNTTAEAAQSGENSWQDFRKFAAQGHEFGSHTVTHAALAVLDEPNMLYELERSREDILEQLGPEHTFSVEGPFGVSDPRTMDYLLRLFPAPRNIMPDPYLEILLRGSRKAPGSSDREYVQWQKGPDGTKNDGNSTDTSLDEMKAWVDTTLVHDNVWLTMVFHGIDDVGWSAMPHERVDGFLEYLKANEDRLWVATFGDATRYMRERKNARIDAREARGELTVNVTHPLDPKWYRLPLTVKTFIADHTRMVRVTQGKAEQRVPVREGGGGRYVLYRVSPNEGPVTLTGL